MTAISARPGVRNDTISLYVYPWVNLENSDKSLDFPAQGISIHLADSHRDAFARQFFIAEIQAQIDGLTAAPTRKTFSMIGQQAAPRDPSAEMARLNKLMQSPEDAPEGPDTSSGTLVGVDKGKWIDVPRTCAFVKELVANYQTGLQGVRYRDISVEIFAAHPKARPYSGTATRLTTGLPNGNISTEFRLEKR